MLGVAASHFTVAGNHEIMGDGALYLNIGTWLMWYFRGYEQMNIH